MCDYLREKTTIPFQKIMRLKRKCDYLECDLRERIYIRKREGKFRYEKVKEMVDNRMRQFGTSTV